MEDLKRKKTKPMPITGRTIIDHARRRFLDIDCDTYCMMDYIYKCVQQHKEVTIESTYRNTGFLMDRQGELIKKLVKEDFLFPLNRPVPRITSKWENSLSNYEKEFEEFWYKEKDGKKKAVWPGSKKNAFDKFCRARNTVSFEHLITKRDEYLEYLSWEKKKGFSRQIMIAERWLNPKNEHYNEPWDEYTYNIKVQLGYAKEDKTKQPTQSDIKDTYKLK